MSDLNNTPEHDDHGYQFEEEVSNDLYATEEEATKEAPVKKSGGLSTKQKIIYGVGIILLGYGAYSLFFGHSSSSSSATIPKTFAPTKSRTNDAQILSQIKPTKPSADTKTLNAAFNKAPATKKASTLTQTQTNQELTTLVKTMQQRNEAFISELKNNYQKQLTNLGNKEEAITAQIAILKARVKGLSNSVRNLNKAVAEDQVASHKKKKVFKHSDYHVEAIIPGRAWLTDSKGNTITVSVGDEIKGFGKVYKISPSLGTVKMSKGTVFNYGVVVD